MYIGPVPTYRAAVRLTVDFCETFTPILCGIFVFKLRDRQRRARLLMSPIKRPRNKISMKTIKLVKLVQINH